MSQKNGAVKRGLVIGKFYPLSRGHQYLIRYAQERVDELWVIVCQKKNYELSPLVRAHWIEQLFPHVKVVVIHCDHLADDDSKGWAIYTSLVLGFVPDVVFTSEDYGEPYARYMGAQHVLVDKERITVPCSGTMIRADIGENMQWMDELVQSYFIPRVAILGAESSGKSTISKALAESFGTAWAPEYGRLYWEGKRRKHTWTSREFEGIARNQHSLEDHLALDAHQVLICDTNAFLTGVWHERYMHTRSATVEAIARSQKYALTLVSDISGVPYEQDGTRDDVHNRGWMHEQILCRLAEESIPYTLLQGSFETRLGDAVERVTQMLTQKQTLSI